MRNRRSHRRALKKIELVSSNTSNNSTTVTIPSGILKGDLIVFYQYAGGTFGTPSYVDPGDNFITIGGSVGPTWSVATLDAKIADGTESGATITGMNGDWQDSKIVMVFRGNRPFTRFWVNATFLTEMTDGNPASQVIPAAAASGPGVALAFMASRASVDVRSATPAMQGEINSSVYTYGLYDCQVGGYHDITVDMNDEGTNQALLSGFIELEWAEDRLNTLSLFSGTSNTSGTITTPSTVQPGDILVLMEEAGNSSGTPADTYDSGFEKLATVSATGIRISMSAKIANEADISRVLTGIDGTSFDGHILLVIRGNRPAQSFTAFSPVSAGPTNSNPGAITITDQSSQKARVHLAVYDADGTINPRTFSSTKDGEVSPYSSFYGAYKFFDRGEALTNSSIDMDDEGDDNTLLAVGIEVT